MLVSLITSFYSWLPASLWIPACAVISVFFLSVSVKILTIVFDFIFKFLDLFH